MRTPRLSSFAALLVMAGSGMWSSAAIEADGTGFFPVVVMITNTQGVPLRGVPVRLIDSGKADPKTQSDPAFQIRMEGLEKPCATDANGTAVVFYFARWASSGTGGKRTFYYKPRGKILVEAEGYERVEVDVPKYTDAQNAGERLAPVVSITLKRIN